MLRLCPVFWLFSLVNRINSADCRSLELEMLQKLFLVVVLSPPPPPLSSPPVLHLAHEQLEINGKSQGPKAPDKIFSWVQTSVPRVQWHVSWPVCPVDLLCSHLLGPLSAYALIEHWEADGRGSLPLHNLVSDSAHPHYMSHPLPQPLWDHRSTGQL